MKLKFLQILPLTLCLALASAQAQITPEARALADAVSAKLGGAQTIKLTAKHTLDPSLSRGVGVDRGPLLIEVKRPNQFYILQPAKQGTRELAYDGKTLCLMHPALKHHALEPLKAASVEQFADRAEEKFGFRPPVAELLSGDVAAQLFVDVTSAKVLGREKVGLTTCERLHFEQPGMTGDLWVGVKDKLPRRYLLTYTDLPGQPTWNIRLTKWELDAPVDEALFTKRPGADSTKVQMLKSATR
jgi:hypothetical protein